MGTNYGLVDDSGVEIMKSLVVLFVVSFLLTVVVGVMFISWSSGVIDMLFGFVVCGWIGMLVGLVVEKWNI